MMGYRLLVCGWRREADKKKAANLECQDETQKKSEDELPTYEEKNGKKSRREYIKGLETQVVELAAKNDDQNKELDQTKQELDQTKQELDETKQGLIETQTNLCRTQKVLIKTKKHWPKH
ncbi:Adventurous-gliding motility protein Z [Bienertia sinuspersici]